MNDDVFATPPQPPDGSPDRCPDDIMGLLKSLHRMARRTDLALNGDRYAIPKPIPGLIDRVAAVEEKIDEHIVECQAREKHARKRWSLPKKILVAGLLAGAGALATWGVNVAVARMSQNATASP